MDLLAVFQVAFRRWKILVPALLVSAALSWVVTGSVAPTYEVDGALKVTYPFASTVDESTRVQSNPYYDTPATALVLGEIGKSPDLAAAVNSAGGKAKYQIEDSGKSVLTVTVTDPDRQNTLNTYRTIVAELGQRLDRLQAQKEIPQPYRVTVDDVVQPQDAAVSHSNQLKASVASAVLGLIFSLGICVVVDARLRRRAVGGGEYSLAKLATPEPGPRPQPAPEPGPRPQPAPDPAESAQQLAGEPDDTGRFVPVAASRPEPPDATGTHHNGVSTGSRGVSRRRRQ